MHFPTGRGPKRLPPTRYRAIGGEGDAQIHLTFDPVRCLPMRPMGRAIIAALPLRSFSLPLLIDALARFPCLMRVRSSRTQTENRR